MGTGTRCGLVIRAPSLGNGVIARIRQPETALELISASGGSLTGIADDLTVTFTQGQTYKLALEAIGSTVKLFLDGVEFFSETVTAHATATRHGFTSFGSSLDERYKNFLVRDRS